ncbi:uncharacterized protein EDB91DRAFT_1254135 [Suillus paluster]|uniref:uncharacterized protein n=1 Tax=Suillus paluster TaxID=48578 RepID=UPI001B8818E8|nr:uncharacterized protein EDB91DRAFT_1254135 [Suillus paluster]KAG1726888.1 hypothetical protein EDB91DRAFT_1254135 [Suillus paluster]
MDIKPKAFDDSVSVDSYDVISTSASANSEPSFPESKQECCATVLSRIREIVSFDFTPSSVTPIVNSCAAALPAAEFSDLLQQPDIEDHTALYWAIIKHRPEVLWAFIKYILKFSRVCLSDMRLACAIVSDQIMFARLNLGRTINPKVGSVRCFLGCPPDKIHVYGGNGVGNNKFVVSFRFRMFQTRLRIAQELAVEFVAAGRIWVLCFYVGPEGMWRVEYGLSKHSLPVYPAAVFVIKAHRGPPDCVTPAPLRLEMTSPCTLVPNG